MEGKIVYFEDGGAENTEATFKLVQERLSHKEIKKLVLASTTGTTARKAMDFFKDQEVKLIVVPHQFDFHREKNAFPPELVKALRDLGHDVHFGLCFSIQMIFMVQIVQPRWRTSFDASARGSRYVLK